MGKFEPPLCSSCQNLELPWFDVSCASCMHLLRTDTHVFSILRQWTVSIQRGADKLIEKLLVLGATVNTIDPVTGMTPLHYAIRAGCPGFADSSLITNTVRWLLRKGSIIIPQHEPTSVVGADVTIRTTWTNMNALHIAAFYDVGCVVSMLMAGNRDLTNSVCRDFDFGTALHIAAEQLSLEATKQLLSAGVDPSFRDMHERTPVDCLPEPSDLIPHSAQYSTYTRLRTLLDDSLASRADYGGVNGKVTLQALGFSIGDEVELTNGRSGYLRFCGTVQFAAGIWGGVELDEPRGRNDGSVDGISYFSCLPNHGVFAPINRISKKRLRHLGHFV